MRSSKELAARLRFDRFPKPDFFRRRYVLMGVAAVLVAAGGWGLLQTREGQRLYLPGAVTPNHATFGDRCQNCHDSYGSVSNEACSTCHPARGHSEFVTHEASCSGCHVEHLGEPGMLAIDDRACSACHADLATKRENPAIATRLSTFAGHPLFTPHRDGASDTAAIRFNHKMHLTSTRVANAAPDAKGCEEHRDLTCASCHQLDLTGKRMVPVSFDKDCRCCHEQVVTPDVGSITTPHTDPQAIRDVLAVKLLELGVERSQSLFAGSESVLPGVRGRGPIDESNSLREFRDRQIGVFEAELYQPFDPQTPLFDNNTKCFLCHDLESPPASQGELPLLKKTAVPSRWLRRAEFSHRKHDMMACRDCHGDLDTSALTSDVNLPGKKLCESCHRMEEAGSAGTRCVLCHLYHDTSKDPVMRARRVVPIALPVLLGEEAPASAGSPELR